MVGREHLTVLVVAMLMFATGSATHTHSADPRSTAMQSMSVLIGPWQCRAHLVNGSDYAYSMKIATVLGGSWMEAELDAPPVGRLRAWGEKSYWTYVPLTKAWELNTLDSSGNFGDFGATWWKGSTIVWHGRRIIMGHAVDRAIEWTKMASRLEVREYDSDVEGHRVLMSSALCSKSR